MALVAEAKRMLEAAVSKPGLGAETEVGQAIIKSLGLLGKVMPEGTVTPGMQNAGMQQWMMQGRRENPMAAIIAALGQGGGGQPGGGAPQPGPKPLPAM